MKKHSLFSLLLTLALCLALCLSLCMTGLAAAEVTGVTIGLVEDSFTVSAEAQTVTATIDLTLSGADTVAARGANFNLSLPEGWTLESYTLPSGVMGKASATAGMWFLMSGSVDVSSLATLVIVIPADTPAGTYTISVSSVKVNDENNNVLYKDGTAIATVTVTASSTPAEPDIQVFGHTLTLKGEIGINTYLSLSDTLLADSDLASYCVEYWKTGKTDQPAASYLLKEGTPRTFDGKTVYGFTATTVAKEMDTVFYLRIKQGDSYISFADMDGDEVNGETGVRCSVNAYLNNRISKGSDAMKPLAKAMKAYGIFAKHYFAARDDASYSTTLETVKASVSSLDFTEVTAADLSAYDYTGSLDIDHFKFEGTTLVLDAETDFRVYFTSDDKDALTITYKEKGSEDAEKELTIQESSDGKFYVEIKDIPAKDLDRMYTFHINNGSVVKNLDHGPLGYARWALSYSDNENLQYAMMALYRYNQAAKAYFDVNP